MIDAAAFAATADLPEHKQVLEALFRFFGAEYCVTGAWVSGSVAAGGMDVFSDLDVAFLCRDASARETLWSRRWAWDVAPWFHRFDADHIGPYFVIYHFEPAIKADIHLHVADDLPGDGGAPYLIAWDEGAVLGDWARAMNVAPALAIDWARLVHEDERLWAWVFYSAQHVRRGEYYDVAAEFGLLRRIVENWHARLAGRVSFDWRRAETREPAETIEVLADLFPTPDRVSLKRALRTLIRLHDQQRAAVEHDHLVSWRTSETARARIRAMVEDL